MDLEFYNWIGYIAAFLTTGGFFPQVLKVWKTNRTEDLSFNSFLLLTVGVLLWFIYGIGISAYPVIIANAFTLIFVCYIMIKIKINNNLKK